jgi:uncharacterized protein (DUF885 family)
MRFSSGFVRFPCRDQPPVCTTLKLSSRSFSEGAYLLKRFSCFAALLLLLFSTGLSAQKLPLAAATPATVEDRRKALDGLFHSYWEDLMRHDPEYASTLGDKRWNDKLTDRSVKAENDRVARRQELLMQLAAIDPNGLGDQEKTSRELLMRQCLDDMEVAPFKEWEMPITQFGGIYSDLADLARQLNFTSTKDYDDWTARLKAMPTAFDQVSQNMAIGIDDKRVPPKYLLEKALAQVKTLSTEKPEDTPFALPLKKFPASIPAAEQERIRTEMLAAIDKQVQPAYRRFARFLEVSYIPAGRTEPGIWALPDGAAYYKFLIHHFTTTDLTATRIHQIGLDEVAHDEAAMLEIAHQLGYKDLASFRAAVKNDPKLHPTSPQALLDAYKEHVAAMQTKLPMLFGHLPKAKLEVATVPDFRAAQSAAAYYEQGTPDFSRPGRITINLWNATDRSLASVEAISYHEGVPGHHMQISIAQELTGIPTFRQQYGNTAFVEGWALYAEQLGKDAGFYKNPYSDYGRLEADVWRAIRLVVDTGVHSQHWNRQQMVDYFHEHSSIDETNIQSEVDRYIAWPGQALGYKIGQLQILELRAKAQKQLGASFDLRAFNDEAIGAGALPMDMLEARVNTWIAAQGTH